MKKIPAKITKKKPILKMSLIRSSHPTLKIHSHSPPKKKINLNKKSDGPNPAQTTYLVSQTNPFTTAYGYTRNRVVAPKPWRIKQQVSCTTSQAEYVVTHSQMRRKQIHTACTVLFSECLYDVTISLHMIYKLSVERTHFPTLAALHIHISFLKKSA